MSNDYEENNQQSVVQDAGDIYRNTKDAYKLADKAVHKYEDYKNKQAEAKNNADKPQGKDITPQNQGQNNTPKGADIGNKPAGTTSPPQGTPVNASATGNTIGSGANATATGAGATTTGAGATATGATATGAGATATGAGATATGVGASATGAGVTGTVAVASGIPTAGVGTIVTLAVAGTVAVATAGLAVAKKIGREADEIVDRKPGKGIGGFAGLLIVLIGVIIFSSVALFTPVAGFAGLVADMKDGVTTFFVSHTEKAEFFAELFDEEEYDVELHREVNSQKGVDAQNVEVYKAITDKAIEKSFSYYMWNVLLEPDKVMLTIFDKIGVSRYSSEASIAYYLNQPYPYSLIKSDGSYYTIGDYLTGAIPEEDLNNDLNYAEILAVYCQNEDNIYTSISYDDFYNFIVQEYNSNFLYELELSDTPQWYYIDAEGVMVLCDDEEEAKAGAEEAEAEREEAEEEEEDDDEDSDEDSEEESEEESEIDSWGYFFEVKVMPYGLNELYHIADVDMDAINYATLSITNRDMLNENEKWLRAYLGNSVDLGPSYADERTYRSVCYNCYTDQGERATGRSLNQYLENSVTTNFIAGLLPEYSGGSYDDYEKIEIDLDVSDTHIINMPAHILQGNYKTKRGNGGDNGNATISSSGCIDCCYAMCAMYYNGYTEPSTYMPQISKEVSEGGYVIGESFDGATFSTDNNMIVTRINKSKLDNTDFTNIINNINCGYPVIISIEGRWEDDEGYVLHQSHRTHFIVLIGYTTDRFIVYDPGSQGTTNYGIPFTALDNVKWCSYRTTAPANADFVPSWKMHPDNPFGR
ncbi:MAG: C39 family peptidase [Lachnospiraceae bacterium]|nr:C39 family peptidase [Lachnospiraceae bacterium]